MEVTAVGGELVEYSNEQLIFGLSSFCQHL